MTCPTCEVYREQITWLRDELRKKDDQLLAVASPIAHAAVTQRTQPASQPEAVMTDPQGRSWIHVNGRAIPLEQYQQLMAGAAVIVDGQIVPEAEYQDAMQHIERAVNGNA